MRTKAIITILGVIAIAPAVLFGSGAARANTMQSKQPTAQTAVSSAKNTPKITPAAYSTPSNHSSMNK